DFETVLLEARDGRPVRRLGWLGEAGDPGFRRQHRGPHRRRRFRSGRRWAVTGEQGKETVRIPERNEVRRSSVTAGREVPKIAQRRGEHAQIRPRPIRPRSSRMSNSQIATLSVEPHDRAVLATVLCPNLAHETTQKLQAELASVLDAAPMLPLVLDL